ncbi:hypothetical protein [Oleisolibacter albus]|uniref:hypothetical protein n=1 Tax=Oleisolibacter albus TaxID=2171757 RepID=UPI0012D71494|nr:hypothetical protein [Oleisolibacter albus]
MNPLEIAIYALVLSGGTNPVTCTRQDAVTSDMVLCTNGRSARLDERGAIAFDSGVTVVKHPDGSLSFSNGISAHWGSAGWVQFSNGPSIRRQSDGSFKVSTGMRCVAENRNRARCRKED